MASTSQLIAFGLQVSLCRALVCSPPFNNILGVCLHFDSNILKSWCDAQAYCLTVGGELVRGSSFQPLSGNPIPGMTSEYWIGLTDLLTERRTNRSGWRWSDGSLDPPSSGLAWQGAEPNKNNDCIRQCLGGGELCESPCHLKRVPVCQPRALPSSAARAAGFQAAPIPVGLPAEDFAEGGGCSRMITDTVSKIECSALCLSEPKEACVAFYFNKERKECRLVLHTDATIDMGSGHGWQKLVKKQ